MAGQLTIDTLRAGSGVLATQNGMSGIAKAWVNFNGTGTPSISGSFNVSSITDNGTGDYSINFTTAMPNANYSMVGTATHDNGGYASMVFLDNDNTPMTTARVRINVLNDNFSFIDASFVCISVFA
jgi:hypothetical protein